MERLPKVISEMVGGALPGAAANRQVCPTISEMTFGNYSGSCCPAFCVFVPRPHGRSYAELIAGTRRLDLELRACQSSATPNHPCRCMSPDPISC